MLYVGHEALVWECYNGVRDEMLGSIRFDQIRGQSLIQQKRDFRDWIDRPKFKVTQRSDPLDESAFKEEKSRYIVGFTNFWNQVVLEYKEKSLSFAKDRVIAFAGVASAVRDSTRYTYSAGLWQETLPMSLLWQFSRSGRMVEESVEKAPSWSWFSVRIREKNGIWGEGQAGIANGMNRKDDLVHQATVKGVRSGVPRGDWTHNFIGTQILLELLTIPATLLKSKDKMTLKLPALESGDGQDSPEYEVEYCHDDRIGADEVFESRSNDVVAGLVTELLLGKNDDSTFESHVLEGLTIVRCTDRDAWQRVGRWRYHVVEYHSKVPLPICRQPYFERYGDWKRTDILLA
jgi:hypothetical protein